jgi:hypothetical protein
MLAAMVSAGLSVQAKPNFAGTWELKSSDSPAAVGAKPVVVTLTQTESALTVKNGDQAVVFQLDGSETMAKTKGSSTPEDLGVRAWWEGASIVVQQRTATASNKTTITISPDGKELTIDTIAATPQGERREKQVFKKSQ